MSEKVEKFKEHGLVAVSEDQKALVKRTIFMGASDDELALYFYECQRRGVHPLDRLIFPIKRKDTATDTYRVSFQAAIDYLRAESESSWGSR